jgi:Domain of unknown function (DUF4390)
MLRAPAGRRPRGFLWVSRILLGIGLVLASPCSALEVELDPPHENGGRVWVNLRLVEVFSQRVEESLSRGMPATLVVHAELWRRRGGWFDRLESSFEGSIKIRYEVWSKLYLLERKALPTLSVTSLDSVRTSLSRPMSLPVSRVGRLTPGSRYYVVASVTLKPLTVEDIEEGEGWLSGEVDKRPSGVGFVTGIPRSVFDAVRNFAGFGDERDRAISEDFRLEDLFPAH